MARRYDGSPTSFGYGPGVQRWTPGPVYSWGLLADAEGGEDDVEEIFGRGFAGDLAEGIESLARLEGEEFGGERGVFEQAFDAVIQALKSATTARLALVVPPPALKHPEIGKPFEEATRRLAMQMLLPVAARLAPRVRIAAGP